jgi:hypothetical protein
VVQAFETLRALSSELLADNILRARVLQGLGVVFRRIGVQLETTSDVMPAKSPPQIQKQLNCFSYVRGLHNILTLFPTLVPDALGHALAQHLSCWLNPMECLQQVPSAEAQDKMVTPYLPSTWTPGDEARVLSSILDLFHLLPPSSRELLSTSKTEDGKDRHGLVVLTIKLEQVLSL